MRRNVETSIKLLQLTGCKEGSGTENVESFLCVVYCLPRVGGIDGYNNVDYGIQDKES